MTIFSLVSWISWTTVKEFVRNKANIERSLITNRNNIDMTQPYSWEIKVANLKERTNNILLNVKNWGNIKIILQDEKWEPIIGSIPYQISFIKNVESLGWIEKILETQRLLLNKWKHSIWNTLNMDTEISNYNISWISWTTSNGEINLFGSNYSVNIFIEKPVFYTIEKEDGVIVENLKGLNMEYTNTWSEMKDFFHWNNYFINM